jgi:hypothetical protein
MHLSRIDREVDPVENLISLDSSPKTFDFKQTHESPLV